MANQKKGRGCLRTGSAWVTRGFVVILLLGLIIFAVAFRKPLYNRFYVFPQQQNAWEQIRAARTSPLLRYDWPEFRGVMHSHTALSHDSDVSNEEILSVLKDCDLDFIFLSDHYDENGNADYSKQWKGLHDGKLFVRGFEMEGGFMPWGMPDNTVFNRKDDLRDVARRIEEAGGLLFFSHCEEDRLWHLDELDGMEIYNIHVDAKAANIKNLIGDVLLSANAYPDHVARLLFRRPTPFLERLDAVNRTRKIVPYGGNDCHQNQGIRLIYTNNDTLLVKETGGDAAKFDIKEFKLNALKRLGLRVMFGPLEPGKQLYRMDLDRYNVLARFVNTHVLAHGLTETDLIEALKAGRVFVAFDMIADARGFVWQATGETAKAIVGETIKYEPGVKLQAAAPNECRFTVLRDGVQIARNEGRLLDVPAPGPGKYRVEAELNVRGEWTPWIYSNYVELAASDPAGAVSGPPVP